MLTRIATIVVLLHLGGFSTAAAAGHRVISETELRDKLKGMWIGQLIGNATGRPTEGVYSGPEPNPAESVPWVTKLTWDADDDTDIEYIALHTLETHGFDCNARDIAEQWLDHIGADGIYIANKQAWSLMFDGHLPPQTGSRTYNQHWYSIDAQIGTEILGALSPGLPGAAIDLAGRFGHATNSGFAVHAAQFYAAMYAEAFFKADVIALVKNTLAALPSDSRTTEVVRDILDWHEQDRADGQLDWRTARRLLYQEYQGADSLGRYYNWVESTINTGATVLALLYGEGDFEQTVQIAVLAGWDCDCNPATAAGLLGIVLGFRNLPPHLTDPSVSGDAYVNVHRPGLPDPTAALPQTESIDHVAHRMAALAAENILLNGGYWRPGRFGRFFYVPDIPTSPIQPEKPSFIGRSSLISIAPAMGITVAVDASVARRNTTRDRLNLDSIVDGITNNASNGHRPYYTYQADPAVRPSVDWYELSFSASARFEGLTFYEGDLIWSGINTYYRDDQPRGGFFEDLTVQVRQGDNYVEPDDLQASVDLDPHTMYQTIAFSFTPLIGDAIRVIGTPGGSDRFTTVLELIPYGQFVNVPEDPNNDL